MKCFSLKRHNTAFWLTGCLTLLERSSKPHGTDYLLCAKQTVTYFTSDKRGAYTICNVTCVTSEWPNMSPAFDLVCPLIIFLKKCDISKYILGLLQAKSKFVSSLWINLPLSISYLAYRAIVEEEEGTDKSKHSPGNKVGTQPAQNTPHHQHRVSMSKHYQGCVPRCQPEILHNHR